jgi:hypothetical protein
MLITAATESPWTAFEAMFGVWLRSGSASGFLPGLHRPRLAEENGWTRFLHHSHIQLRKSIPPNARSVKGKTVI